MTILAADLIRVAINLVAAIGQIVLAVALFRNGFQPARAPLSTGGPTPIEPAGYAFQIWALIYAGCLAYAVYQALPVNVSAPMFRQVGWWTALGFVGCMCWLLVAKYGPILATVPIISIMAGALLVAFLIVSRDPSMISSAGRWFVVTPLAVYAGWLSVALFANLSEVLPGYGFDRFGLSASGWAIAMLVLASVLASAMLNATEGNWAYALTVLWALGAIAMANLVRAVNIPVAVVCATGAGLVLWLAFRFQPRPG